MQKYKVKTSDKNADTDKDSFLQSFGVTMQYARGEALKKAKLFHGKTVKGEKHERNVCPKCGAGDLDYYKNDTKEDTLCFLYTCNSCSHEGVEVFEAKFTGHEEKQYLDR